MHAHAYTRLGAHARRGAVVVAHGGEGAGRGRDGESDEGGRRLRENDSTEPPARRAKLRFRDRAFDVPSFHRSSLRSVEFVVLGEAKQESPQTSHDIARRERDSDQKRESKRLGPCESPCTRVSVSCTRYLLEHQVSTHRAAGCVVCRSSLARSCFVRPHPPHTHTNRPSTAINQGVRVR